MTFVRALPVAMALAVAALTQAAAQEPPQFCVEQFTAVRKSAEDGASAIKAASERKAPREEVCGLFKRYATAESKMIKFMTENQSWCGIPAQAITQLKSNHGNTVKIRNNVCSAAPAAAAGPSLSDALGTSALPDTSAPKKGRGTFDTLTGNALSR